MTEIELNAKSINVAERYGDLIDEIITSQKLNHETLNNRAMESSALFKTVGDMLLSIGTKDHYYSYVDENHCTAISVGMQYTKGRFNYQIEECGMLPVLGASREMRIELASYMEKFLLSLKEFIDTETAKLTY